MTLFEDLKKFNPETNVSLRGHTSFKIGGVASCFIRIASLNDLRDCIQICSRNQTPIKILGGGSNILVDRCLQAPVIQLTGSIFRAIQIKPNGIYLGASVTSSQALQWMISHDYAGLEFMAGIPATVGGSLIMNASAFNLSIADSVIEVYGVDRQGVLKVLEKKDIVFKYRYSSLTEYVIIGALFDFPKQARDHLKKRIKDIMQYRQTTQELTRHTAGCIFKNPSEHSAGYLIEKSGLKGFIYRDASISTKHANFIINRGHATYDDVSELIRIVKEKVQQSTGVVLEEEVIRWTA